MVKNILLAAMLALGLAQSACTSSTAYGECLGVNEDQDTGLRYKVSAENVVLAAIFSETIFVPIIVVVNETYCPVGRKG